MDEHKFEQLIKDVKRLSERLDKQPIFIGGIASYLYSQEFSLRESTTHDADLFIGYNDYYLLEDLYGPIQVSRSLNKMEIIVNQIDFDVYLEDQSDLIYSYQDMLKFSKILDGIRVPSPEHLIALKLKAAIDRKDSDRGIKDKMDIIKLIFASSQNINKEILSDNKFPLKEFESFLDALRKEKLLISEVALDFGQEKALKKELDNYFEMIRKMNLEKNYVASNTSAPTFTYRRR